MLRALIGGGVMLKALIGGGVMLKQVSLKKVYDAEGPYWRRYAELPKEVKNSISHRYRAVKAMADNFIQHCDDPDSGSQSS
ncbi:UNVERIFIED_CONTAM: hypothetical protein FKN15_022029 [Acipenser sinensis]